MVPVLTWVFTSKFLVWLLWLGCAADQRSTHLYVTLICWLRVVTVLFCVFWSLCSWRCWRSRRLGFRRYHNGWHTDTLGGLFEHICEMCMFHWWRFFSGKKQKTNSPQVIDYQDFWIIRHQIKGLLLYFSFPLSVSFLKAPYLLIHLSLVLYNLSNAQC